MKGKLKARRLPHKRDRYLRPRCLSEVVRNTSAGENVGGEIIVVDRLIEGDGVGVVAVVVDESGDGGAYDSWVG